MQSKDGKADHRGPAPVSGVVPQGQNPAGTQTENSMMVSVTGILERAQQKIDIETIDADPHSRATLPTIPLPNAPERSPDAEWELLKATLAEAGLEYEDGFPSVDHIDPNELLYLFRGLGFGLANHRFTGEAKFAAQRYMVMIEQLRRDSMPPSKPNTALGSAGAQTKESPMGTENPAAGPVPAPAADDPNAPAKDIERDDGFLAPDEFQGPESTPPPATEQDDGPSFSDPDIRRNADRTADVATLPKTVPVKRAVGGLMVPPARTEASVTRDAETLVKSPAAASPQGSAARDERPSRPPPPSRRPDTESEALTLMRPSSPPPASPRETLDAPTLIRPSQHPPPATPAAPGGDKPALASKAPPPPSSRVGAAPVRRRPATRTGNTPPERVALWDQNRAEDEGILSDLPPSPDGPHPSVPPPPPAPPAPASGLDGAHQQVLDNHMEALDDLMTAAAVSMDHGRHLNAEGSVQLAGSKIKEIDGFVNAAGVPDRIRLTFTKRLNKARERLTALRMRLDDARSAAKKPEEPKPNPVPQTPTGQGSGHMTQSNIGAGPSSKTGPPLSSGQPQNGKPKSGSKWYWKALVLIILAGAAYLMMFSSGPSSDQTAHVWSSENCKPITAELVKKYFHQSDPAHLAGVEEAKPGDPRIDFGGKTPDPVSKIIANVYDVSDLKICGINKSPTACVDATAENLKKYIGQSDPAHVVQVEVPLPDDPYIEANGKQLTPVEQRTLSVYDVSHAKVCTSK